jgi:hypothetical protein
LVEQGEGILVVLDPNRLLDSHMRDVLEPALRSARGFIDRQRKLEELWGTICTAPTLGDVRNYSRLSKRSGRPKAATATRTVLKFMESADAAPESSCEGLVRDLLRFAQEGASGEVVYQPADGGGQGKIMLAGGRVVDAGYEGDWGWLAFKNLLACTSGTFSFVSSEPAARPERISGSTVSLVIECLEAISEGRKGRRGG